MGTVEVPRALPSDLDPTIDSLFPDELFPFLPEDYDFPPYFTEVPTEFTPDAHLFPFKELSQPSPTTTADLKQVSFLLLSPSSPLSETASASTSSSKENTPTIFCSWPSCAKSFNSRREYNQHCRCHTKPFICEEALCTARFGTKTHLQRHKNVNHRTTIKFYCKVAKCSRSRAGGRHFNRMDYCKNHVKKKHQMGAEGVDMVTDGVGV